MCHLMEALRIHSDNAERNKGEREAAAATVAAAATAAAAGVSFHDARPNPARQRQQREARHALLTEIADEEEEHRSAVAVSGLSQPPQSAGHRQQSASASATDQRGDHDLEDPLRLGLSVDAASRVAEVWERSARLAQELTRAESRLEHAVAAAAAAIDVAERGATEASDAAASDSRALVARLEETDGIAARVTQRADALELAVERGAAAAAAARWAHVSRCNRYRDLLRR